jgi:hypothetical protein
MGKPAARQGDSLIKVRLLVFGLLVFLAVQEHAISSGRSISQRLAYAELTPPLYVAIVRFNSALRPQPPIDAARELAAMRSGWLSFADIGDPIAIQSIAAGLNDLWKRDRDALIAAIRAIPDTAERDRTAYIIATAMGCVEMRWDSKLDVLMECHSRWQDLAVTADYLPAAPAGMRDKAIAKLPPGPLRDHAHLHNALRQFSKDPAAALTAALAARQAPKLSAEVSRTFKEWNEDRPQEAAEWLAERTPEERALVSP